MNITTKGRYGLRAIVDLATYCEEEPVSISCIAARQGISERYLEQLMAKFKKAGFVKSIRGATGGYILAKPAEELSVGDVLRVMEGDLEIVNCMGFHEEGHCESKDHCVTKYVWKKINESIIETVNGIRISQLVEMNKMAREGKCDEEIDLFR